MTLKLAVSQNSILQNRETDGAYALEIAFTVPLDCFWEVPPPLLSGVRERYVWRSAALVLSTFEGLNQNVLGKLTATE